MMELNYLNDAERLITNAETLRACQDGMEQLRGAKSVSDFIACYYDRLDYCLANNFPSIEFLKGYRSELRDADVYLDESFSICNPSKFVLLGESECTAILDKYTVCCAYVKHKSKLHIQASGNAVIMVDSLDDSVITVEISDHARVIVHQYAKSVCKVISGTPKIHVKNRFTYDLQDR